MWQFRIMNDNNNSKLDEFNELITSFSNAEDFLSLESSYHLVQDHPLYTIETKELKVSIDKLYDSCGLNLITKLFAESSNLPTLEAKYQIAKLSEFYTKEKKPISNKFTNLQAEIDEVYAHYKNCLLYDLEFRCNKCDNISKFSSEELENKDNAYCRICSSSKVYQLGFFCSDCSGVIGKYETHACEKVSTKETKNKEDPSKRISWRNTRW